MGAILQEWGEAYRGHTLGGDPGTITAGRMTYDLRRLRLRGLIARIPGRRRYRPTPEGSRTALFCSRLHARVLRRGLAAPQPPPDSPLRAAFDRFQAATDRFREHALADA